MRTMQQQLHTLKSFDHLLEKDVSQENLYRDDPFKHNVNLIVFKNSVGTENINTSFSIIKIHQSMLFEKPVLVYFENHMKPLSPLDGQNAELLNINVGGTYAISCHCTLRETKQLSKP